jgi:hypothetical protein
LSFSAFKEIFGMDLMLDKKMKVWMCEVNTDPGLGYPDKEAPWLRFRQVDFVVLCRALLCWLGDRCWWSACIFSTSCGVACPTVPKSSGFGIPESGLQDAWLKGKGIGSTSQCPKKTVKFGDTLG